VDTSNLDTDFLYTQFSFGYFLDYEVIALFEKVRFSLGHKEEIRLQVVQKFHSLLKSRFKKVMSDLHEQHKIDLALALIDRNLVDISSEVLDASNIFCWNCRELKKPFKRQFLSQNLQLNNINIVGIQET
jgi:hypothetical protein